MTGKDLGLNHCFTKWENAVVIAIDLRLFDGQSIDFENNLPMNL